MVRLWLGALHLRDGIDLALPDHALKQTPNSHSSSNTQANSEASRFFSRAIGHYAGDTSTVPSPGRAIRLI
ncbi:hypothetical protein BSU04_03070 [Caballeronia sordidicola]|uniref:Uncharacterized protein n=1 Tax=Caballeronia sordidicola TaxID=196367 RepID=A0A226XB88_CABSO|nr:hypothetical protein BSU04_03070 [Caballeronia sordidicola]